MVNVTSTISSSVGSRPRAHRTHLYSACLTVLSVAPESRMPASGTKDVPRHIENAESRAVQESSNHIVFIEPVPGGKGESIDTAKLAIRRVLDEFFDRTHRFRLRRLSQSNEEILSFGGKFHERADRRPQHRYRVARKTESKGHMRIIWMTGDRTSRRRSADDLQNGDSREAFRLCPALFPFLQRAF